MVNTVHTLPTKYCSFLMELIFMELTECEDKYFHQKQANKNDMWKVIQGDFSSVIKDIEPNIQSCITSPPYWQLRDYGGIDGELGGEDCPELYTERLVSIFRIVRDVLRPDGCLWLNLGDAYCGGGGTALTHRQTWPGANNQQTEEVWLVQG